jgi:peroxiredoxin
MEIQTLKLGDKAPDFSLPGVDGKTYALKDFDDKKILVVAFTCNHCPYVQAYEDRIVALQRDYGDKGVQLVAINSNDESQYPEDDFDHMVERARMKGFNFPYLRDETQEVAERYGPKRTPEMFVFDSNRVLRYHGAIDDNYEDANAVTKEYLRAALDAILWGHRVPDQEVPPVGCSVKWKPA